MPAELKIYWIVDHEALEEKKLSCYNDHIEAEAKFNRIKSGEYWSGTISSTMKKKEMVTTLLNSQSNINSVLVSKKLIKEK